jgi:U4/U6.U5 tri-snRNP-associated protein 2
MKRVREADEAAAAQPPADAPAPLPLSEDDDSSAQPRRLRHAAAAACPFLDTVNRSALDFDFEKCCSVTLSPLLCYA